MIYDSIIIGAGPASLSAALYLKNANKNILIFDDIYTNGATANECAKVINEELALTLNGKKRNIHRKDFLAFAQNCEISPSAAEKMTNKLCHLENAFLAVCEASYLSDELKTKTSELISERIYRLK